LVLAGGAITACQGPVSCAVFSQADESLGFIVLDTTSGEVLDQSNAKAPMIPASLAKIPALAAVRAVLSRDHRFATRFSHLPSRPGALVFSGNDPTLDFIGLSDLLGDLAQQAQNRDRPPNGWRELLVDPGSGPQFTEITRSQAQAASYNPGLSDLALNFNRVRLLKRQGIWSAIWGGDPAQAPIPNIKFTLGPPQSPIAVNRRQGIETWILPQDLGGEIELPVGSIPQALAATLPRLIGPRATIGQIVPSIARGAEDICSRDSQPLDNIIAGCLQYSTNITAEMLGLYASGLVRHSAPDTLAESGTTLLAILTRRHTHIDWRGAVLENASGLGVASRLSPVQLVDLIRAERDFSRLLRPVGSIASTRLRVKTGTMAYVRGLAGQFETDAGAHRTFAIMTANGLQRARLDQVTPPPLAIPPESRAWLAQAKDQERALLKRWGAREAAIAAL
jgi:D-alanyl-D-alanine carboxypeptidase/D-alanyl-D-alanine-endopeptidase (penicillin-binding protein 4)